MGNIRLGMKRTNSKLKLRRSREEKADQRKMMDMFYESESRSKQLERLAQDEWKKENDKIKLLLLGTSHAGKTTLFKQMRIVYGKSYSPEELASFKEDVHRAFLHTVKIIIENDSRDSMKIDQDLSAQFTALNLDTLITPETSTLLLKLSQDPEFRRLWNIRSDQQGEDTLGYFFTNIERISDPDYVPTNQDVVFVSAATSGIFEEHYSIDGVEFVMFDVGGQKTERKKWMHIFDHVTAVIFVAAANEFDEPSIEHPGHTKLQDAVEVFDEICSSPSFQDVPVILFLNKKDLLRQKLLRVPLKSETRFQDFSGPHVVPGTSSAVEGSAEFEECYEAAAKYIMNLFLKRNGDQDFMFHHQRSTNIYHHFTCATDLHVGEFVFGACKDIILR